MRICILGAGSLGSAMGGFLAKAGNDVVLINRNAAHCDRINSDGLTLVIEDREERIRVAAATTPEGLAPADLVMVMVKSFDTEAAIRAATHLVSPGTVVLSLQNGLGHEEIIGAVVGRERVIAGKTYVGGQMVAPGRIIAGAAGKETIIGELDGSVSDRVRRVADTFDAAGLATVVSDNIVGAMWDKLLVNVATGALSGITRLDYGNLYSVPELEATGIAAVAEAMQVADALGIRLATKNPRDAWTKAGNRLPFVFKPSVLQSLEKGSITEIDFVNGAIVRAGAKAGIATPVNATLVACIKGIERALAPLTAPAGTLNEVG